MELEDGRSLQMQDLRVGDRVRTAIGFETVYAFGHYSKESAGVSNTYLQIHTESTSEEMGPIELSPDHLIFLEGRDDPVPAENVKVGDVVVAYRLGSQTVTNVKTVKRNGMMHPYTASGTIVVNGIVASTFADFVSHFGFQNTLPFLDGKLFGVSWFSYHNMQKSFYLPLQYFCQYGSTEWCQPTEEQMESKETYKDPLHRVAETLLTTVHKNSTWMGGLMVESFLCLAAALFASALPLAVLAAMFYSRRLAARILGKLKQGMQEMEKTLTCSTG